MKQVRAQLDKGNRRRCRRNLRPRIVSGIIGSFAAFVAASAYSTGQGIWVIYFDLAVHAFIAACLRFGWVVPCMIIGTIIGDIADSGPKGGTAESMMWEWVWSVVVCTFLGLATGILLEVATRVTSAAESNENA